MADRHISGLCARTEADREAKPSSYSSFGFESIDASSTRFNTPASPSLLRKFERRVHVAMSRSPSLPGILSKLVPPRIDMKAGALGMRRYMVWRTMW